MTKSKRPYHLDQRSWPSLSSGSPQPFRALGPKPLSDTLSPSDARQCAAGGGGRTDLRLSSPWYSWNVEPSIGLFKMSRPRLKLKIWNAPILNFKKTKVAGGHRWNMPLCPHRCTTVTCVYCPASSAPLGMEDSGALSSVIYRLLSIMKLLNILHKILLHVYDIYEAWMNFV